MIEQLIEFSGWTGALLLSLCGIPLVIASLKDPKVAKSTPLLFLHAWLWGEVLLLLYTCIRLPLEDTLPVLVNYSVNIVCILVVLMQRGRVK
jgi:uncharacterized protein with PQ loop repeat